jgi:hypothetical protein
MTTMRLQDLIQVWRVSEKSNIFPPIATDRELELTESKLGFQLPAPLSDLYRLCNGIYLLNGNLHIYPLEEAEQSSGVSSASEKLRSWGWPIPHEVLVFGDNGGDELFGIWLPDTQGKVFEHPILVIGEIFEPRCMAIEATGLFPFLLGWTAYYCLLYEAESSLLDALGLPESLRFNPDEVDDTVFARLRQWADPNLPDPNPDPYRHGYDTESLMSILNKS